VFRKTSEGWTLQKPFYGWIIVGVAFLIGMTEAGVFQNILAVFLKPMSGEFGWSRATVAGAVFLGSLFAGITAPLIGPLVDRHGPRMVAFFGILVLSAGLVSLSSLKKIWQLYLFFGMGRMIAMGLLGLVVSVSVSNWFIRRRGRAMGIAWLGPRVGGASLPVFTQFMILSFGWRTAWIALGVLVFCLSAIPAVIFLRRRPEDVGLLPDGEPPINKKSEDNIESMANDPNLSAEISDPEWTRAQAVRTPTFWVVTLLNCLLLFPGAGVNFNIFPFLTDNGVSEASAIPALSIMALSGAAGSLLWGFLVERFRTKYILAIEVIVGGLVLLAFFLTVKTGLIWTLGLGIIYICVGIYGIFVGGVLPLLSILWAEFFGRNALGSIQGFVSPFRLTANATGPIFGALCFDFFGSYTFPFWMFSMFYLLSGLIALSLKPPRHPLPKEEIVNPFQQGPEI